MRPYSLVEVLIVLAAFFMLISLWLRSPTFARPLRDWAVIITLLAPLGFLIVAFIALRDQPGLTSWDLATNYEAGRRLYMTGESPYSLYGAISFPFPTFYIYWMISAFGQLNATLTWLALSVLNLALWGLCVVLIRPTLETIGAGSDSRLRWYVIVALPAMLTIWWGQTALVILTGLTLLHLAGQPNRQWRTWVIGGLGFGAVALIKPQIGLVGVGVALWGLFAYREQRLEDVRRVLIILVSAGVLAGALIGLTIMIPGGVSFELYLKFFREVLPQIALGDAMIFNADIGTLAYVLPRLAIDLGLANQVAARLGDGLTVVIVCLAVVWTYQRRQRPLYEIAAGWGAWALLAPRIAFGWYATWCLPFFLLSMQESKSKPRIALLIITLALLNLQLGVFVVSFATMLLFGVLVWTSFTPRPTLA